MYTEQELTDALNQKKRRIIGLGVPALLLLAATVTLFILRAAEVWTMLASCVTCAYCVFTYGLFLSPVTAYCRHMNNVFHARTRATTGKFKDMNELPVSREGVRYYAMLLNVGEMDAEEDDRLFYYDANKPRPDWQKGEVLTITAHDKAVTDWKREQ